MLTINYVKAQETTDNLTYYYNNFETATAGNTASLGAPAMGNANRGASSTTIDAYTSTPLDGATSLQSIKPATNAIGYVRWNFVGTGTGTINLSNNDWEWDFLYKNTTTLSNDDPDQMAVGNNSWRYWLIANAYNGNSTQGFYVSQVGTNLVLRYRYTNAAGVNQYNTILTTAMPNNQSTYIIKIQRLQGGSWAIYMNTYVAGMTTATTLATSSTGTTGSSFSTYYYSYLETTCTTTNRFEWDDFDMYTRSLQFTGINSASNGITQPSFYAGQTNVVLYGLQVNARGNFLVNQLVISATGSGFDGYFSSATLYQTSSPVFSMATATSLGSIQLTGNVAQTFSLSSTITSSGNTNGSLSTGATYYFIVANLSSTLNYGNTPYGTMNFTTVTTFNGNGNSTSMPYSNSSTTSNVFTFGATLDWTGATSSAWANTGNWSPAQIPGVNDAVRIGVKSQTINGFTGFASEPTVSDTRLCASITMGVYKTITLTITSPGTLTVGGAITQNPSATTFSGFTGSTFTGTGSLTAGSLAIGDNVTAPNYGVNNTLTVTSTVTNFHVTSGVTINSTNYGVLIFGYGYNNATFSLQGGTTLIDGSILTANTASGLAPAVAAVPKFSIDMPTGSVLTPILQLTNASAINTSSVAGTIDFYNNTGGTGTCTVQYTGTSQTVYTSTTTALSTTPDIYQYLTLSGAGTKTIGASSGGFLNTGADFTTSASTVLFNTYNPTVTIGNNWTNSSNITQGSGNITVTAAFLNKSGGTLNLGSANLYIGGNYTNSSGGVYTQSTGTTYFNGTGAQALVDNSTTGTTFNNVTFNGSGTSTMSAGTGGVNFSVASTGTLTMASPAKLVAGSSSAAYLTLKSDTLGAATVAPISYSSPISGFVTVQRFVQGSATYNNVTGRWLARNYRLMSSAVDEGKDGNGFYPYSLNYLAASTIITDCTSSYGTTGGNPSLYLFNEFYKPSNVTFTSGNFIGITDINETATGGTLTTTDGNSGEKTYTGEGFMIYFRGDNITHLTGAANKTTYPFVSPESVTFSTTGNLNQGTYPVKSWTGYVGLLYTTSTNTPTVRGFNLVGNPYASSIDWTTYFNGGITTTNINPTIYVFDPVTNQYNTFLATGVGAGTGNPASTTSIIASGQGFFVQSNNSGSALTFTENAKSTTVPTGSSLLLGTPVQGAVAQLLRLRLTIDSIDYDDITVGFKSSASSKYNASEDAMYLSGINAMEGLSSFSDDNVPLAINFLPLPKQAQQVIKLDVEGRQTGLYTLQKTALDAIPQIYEIWLMDNYKKDSLDLRNNSAYAFNVDLADTNSYGKNRFQLVIRQNPALAIHLLNFAATKSSDGSEVVWKTENEQNYTNFTVERSSDGGVTFNVLGGFASSALGSYSFLDKNPPVAADEYRLKIEDLNGNISYSNVVTLIYGNGSNNTTASNISVYPNPAGSVLNLSINQNSGISMPTNNLSALQTLSSTPGLVSTQTTAGTQSYEIKIINITGSVIKTATSSSPTWQDNVGNLSPGTYVIQVVNNGDNTLVGRSSFVKL